MLRSMATLGGNSGRKTKYYRLKKAKTIAIKSSKAKIEKSLKLLKDLQKQFKHVTMNKLKDSTKFNDMKLIYIELISKNLDDYLNAMAKIQFSSTRQALSISS